MTLKIYNTLKRKKEIFKPIKKNKVGIYACGPTIYNYVHIGNLRAYVFSDILRRYLQFLKYNVKEVMNMTDVDDKTIRDSQKQGKSLKEFTKKYEKEFIQDIKSMNIQMPDVIPKATEHINEMVKIIKDLLKKGIAYRTEDGIYFSIKKFKNYGKLAKIKIKQLKAGASERVAKDEYDKENVNDFALWKFYTSEDGNVFWNTEIGKGRPGWHIECSAMSMKYLGESFDIHTGGVDLIFPHHENEIAQSEAYTEKPFVKYFMHNEYLLVDGKKMSKSLGNFYNLKNIISKGFSPIELRYFFLTKNYRQKINFTWKAMESSRKSYDRLKINISSFKDDGKINKEYLREFEKAMDDDLNTSKALQILWKLIRDKKASGKLKTISEMDKVFGLKLIEDEEIIKKIEGLSYKEIDLLFYNCKWKDRERNENKSLPKWRLEEIKKGKSKELIKTFIQETGINKIKGELNNLNLPKEIKKLAEKRDIARKNKDWKTADELREKIQKSGYVINDTKEGYTISGQSLIR